MKSSFTKRPRQFLPKANIALRVGTPAPSLNVSSAYSCARATLPPPSPLGWDYMNFSLYFFPLRNSYSCVTQTRTIKLKTFKL